MTKKLKNTTISNYLKMLSERKPTPGGGSAAALTGALGSSLLIMAARYSVGKSDSKVIDRRIEKMIKTYEVIQDRLTELVDLDAEAYQEVVNAKNGTKVQKNKADRQAKRIPKEVATLVLKSIKSVDYLIEHGNPYLMSDVTAGVEMLMAAHRSAIIFQECH